jgi:hypothetical protein
LNKTEGIVLSSSVNLQELLPTHVLKTNLAISHNAITP